MKKTNKEKKKKLLPKCHVSVDGKHMMISQSFGGLYLDKCSFCGLVNSRPDIYK